MGIALAWDMDEPLDPALIRYPQIAEDCWVQSLASHVYIGTHVHDPEVVDGPAILRSDQEALALIRHLQALVRQWPS